MLKQRQRHPVFIGCLWILGWFSVLTPALLRAQEVAQPNPATATSFDIGFIGLHGGVYEQVEVLAKPLGLRVTYFEDGEITKKTADLGSVQVLYIQHTREEDRDTYRLLLDQALETNPKLRIFVLQANSVEFFRGLNLRGSVERDAKAASYYGSSNENLRRMLVYAATTYLGRDLKVEPPQEVDREGFYHPDHQDFFPSSGAFEVWSQSRGTFHPISRDCSLPFTVLISSFNSRVLLMR